MALGIGFALVPINAWADCASGTVSSAITVLCTSSSTTSFTVTGSGSIEVATSGSNEGSQYSALLISSKTMTGSVINSGILSTTNGGRGWALYVTGSSISQGIVNNGSIISGNVGINLNSSTITGGITNSSSITATVPSYTGGSFTSTYGIQAGWSAVTLTSATVNGGLNNSGSMYGYVNGISLDGSSVINQGISNTGVIVGYQAITLASGAQVNGGVTNGSSVNSAASMTSASNGGISGGNAIYNAGSIDFVSNYGQMTGGTDTSQSVTTARSAIANDSGGVIGSIVNQSTGVISSSLASSGTYQTSYGIYNAGTITSLTNYGTIQGNEGVHTNTGGSIPTITNSGSISGLSKNAITFDSGATFTTLTNSGTISGTTTGLYMYQTQGTTLTNSGTIKSTNTTATQTYGAITAGVFLAGANISNVTNSGTISGTDGILFYNGGAITKLVNTGTISGGTNGVSILTQYPSGGNPVVNPSAGSIGTLENQQGKANSNPLTYTGPLPSSYNIIIASTSNFGQLKSVSSVSGQMAFGISSLSTTSSAIVGQTLAGVLQGFGTALSTYLSNPTASSSNGYFYYLIQEGTTGIWDLVVTAVPATSNSSSASTSSSTTSTSSSTTSTSSSTTSTSPSTTSTTIAAGTTLQGNTTSLQGNIIDNGKLVFDQTGTGTFAGIISGSGSVVVQNSGSVVLSGNNTYSGGTTISSGTLQGNTTSLQGNIIDNGKLVFDQTGTGTFAGIISGSGSVVVQNSGSVVLSGNNTYSGGTTVSSGTLSVSGSSPTGSGNVVVAASATLMGTGTIAGTLTVDGSLKPGNSPGYLSSAQSVILNSGSTYKQDIAGTTQASSTSPAGATGYYSFLNVGGQLVINAGATLMPQLQNLFQTTESGYGSAAYIPNLGDTFRIATAAGGISGTFSAITQPAGLASGTQFLPFYNYAGSNSIDLAVIPTSYATTLASASTNTQSVAAVLDKLSAVQLAGSSTATQLNLMYATATQNAASLASFAQSLTGEIYADTLAVVAQTSQRVQSAVLARLSDTVMPSGSANITTAVSVSPSGVTAQNPLGLPSASVSSNPAVNPAQDIIAPANNNVWGELAYQYGNRSSDSNASGFNSNLYQAVFGADIYQQNGVTAGAGFSVSTTNVSMSSGSGTVGQGSLFVYGKVPVMQDFVLDGLASVGLSSTDVTRTDPTSSSSLKAKGIRGNDVLLSAGISRPFDVDELTVTPYLRANWQMVNQSSFNEGSASVAALSVKQLHR